MFFISLHIPVLYPTHNNNNNIFIGWRTQLSYKLDSYGGFFSGGSAEKEPKWMEKNFYDV